MQKPKNTRQTQKRAQIIQTAERLFTRFGAKRITVEEICREAGVCKMTFYKYFPNKVELVRNIRDDWVEEGFRKFDEINAMDILVSIDDVTDRARRRFLDNITNAQKLGEIRSDIDPRFLWIVTDKLYELVKEGSWKNVFTEFSQFQEQLRTLIFFGLLTRTEGES